MKRFKHSFVVDCDIDRAWRFYTDINHLKIITPKKTQINILKSQDDILKEGTEVWLQAKLVTHTKWHSKITYLRPYEYIDEMISGRFKLWRHVHRFNKLNHCKTEIIDQIDFQLPYGFIGRIFEGYVMFQLSNIFKYRKQATIRVLQEKSKI